MGRRTRDEARNILLDAAEEVIAAKGVLVVRPADVARRAGYSPGNLYTYFDSKTDMLEAVLDRACAHALESATDLTAEEIVLRCVKMPRVVVAIGAVLISGSAESWEGTSNSKRLRTELARRLVRDHSLDSARADLAAVRTRNLLIGLRLTDPSPELTRSDARRLLEWVASTARAPRRPTMR